MASNMGAKPQRDSRCDLCFMALGLGLGDPRVTLGSPKRHPSVTQGSNGGSDLFATEDEKRPGGGVGNRVIVRSGEPAPAPGEAGRRTRKTGH